MSTIVLRSVKGTPLTNTEVDTNFSNLNTDKTELGGTYSAGTANGVLFLSSSKVLTTGSALTFDGTTQALTAASGYGAYRAGGASGAYFDTYNNVGTKIGSFGSENGGDMYLGTRVNNPIIFLQNNAEAMRLTSTGLGIGTSSPGSRLNVVGGSVTLSGTASFNSEVFQEATAKRGLIFGYETASQVGIIASHTNGNPSNLAFWTFSGSAWGERARIDSSGNLGIGTSSPNSPAGSTQTTLHINNSTAGTSPGIHLTNGNTGTNGGDGTLVFVGNAAGTGTTAFNIYNQESSPICFFTDTTEKMRLDASGNLGLGVTPSAWSALKAVELANGVSLASYTGGAVPIAYLTSGTYFNGSNWIYSVSSFAIAKYELDQGVHKWFNAPSGTAGNAISFTQAMTLDASGNLSVGTTSANSRFNVQQSTDTTLGGFSIISVDGNGAVISRLNDGGLTFRNGGSERMRLDSSGNLGLGVTPSAWGSTYRAMQVGLTSSLVGLTNDTRTHLSTNAFFDGTNWKYLATSPAARYSQIDNVHQWYTAPSGTAGDAITFSQAMTLDADGDLGIGTTSPAYKLDVLGTSRVYQSSNAPASLLLNANQGTIGTGYAFSLAQTNSAGNYSFTISEGATTYLTLSNSISGAGGNLGLGVTPSAWSSSIKALQFFGGRAALSSDTTSTWLSNNWFNDGADKYVVTAAATIYRQASGVHSWFTAPSGTAGDAISFTQAMTLDASGRWLLGTTTGVGNDFASIRFNSSGTYSQGLNMVDANASASGGVFQVFRKSDDTYLGNIRRNGTDNAIYVGGNSYLALGSGDTERARIDSSGNFTLRNSSDNVVIGNAVTGGMYLGGGSSNTNLMVFQVGASERARIDSSGNLLIGTTSVFSSGKLSINSTNAIVTRPTSAVDYTVLAVELNSGTQIGSITTSGTLTLYNTTSDQRLKENIQDAAPASALIDALRVREYNWKSNGSHQRYGFIAQELVTVAPEAVHQPADPEEMMAVDYSKLVPMLVKEIQSLRQRLAAAGI
jgi:hypothetical protein